MNEDIAVYIVDSEGNATTLSAKLVHALKCEDEPCTFPACACGPVKPNGVRLHDPVEPRVKAKK